jgi:HEAT repeat protein
VDAELIIALNGRRALATLRDWARVGDVAQLADAATNPEVQSGSRFFAARYLGRFNDQQAISALIEALADTERTVRAQVARSLRSIGAPAHAAVPSLCETLFDGDGHVRISAARALGVIGDPAATPALVKVVETNSWHALDSWATGALVKLGAPEAEPHLLRHLDDEKAWQRRWAARSLGQVGRSPASAEAVMRARKRDLLHRRVYTQAVRRIEGCNTR